MRGAARCAVAGMSLTVVAVVLVIAGAEDPAALAAVAALVLLTVALLGALHAGIHRQPHPPR